MDRPALRPLPLGAVQPLGWMLEQLRRDLRTGFAGRLDRLSPHAARDLFAERLGAPGPGWWDAETRGQWLLGYVQAAHLSGLAGHVRRAEALLDALTATRDADGYLGIYAPRARYRHRGRENAELWAQSRALLALLASGEATGRRSRRAVVEAAVARTLRAHARAPFFATAGPGGRSTYTGLAHGLCFADVLERLDDGGGAYGRWGVRLYGDFSAASGKLADDDLALPRLLDPKRPLGGHAVHTAEHLRALLYAASAGGGAELARAVDAARAKLRWHVLPGGALPGDENVHGVPLPDSGYETCTTTELAASLGRLLQHAGDAAVGDHLERLVLNAGQGARLADGTAVAYLSADTRLEASATRTDAYSAGRPGGRYKYSPTHDDVACCCAPSAVRLLPEHVARLWMATRDGAGLAAAAYGPSRVRARLRGVPVEIVQDGPWPFTDQLSFRLRAPRPVRFVLWLRVPAWTSAARLDAREARVDYVRGWLRVERTWRDGDRVALDLRPRVETVPYGNGERAVLRGPLQYVQPFAAARRVTRRYPRSGLADFEAVPAPRARLDTVPVLEAGPDQPRATLRRRPGSDPRRPWDDSPWGLRLGRVELVPMGCTLLRRAAFPAAPHGRRR